MHVSPTVIGPADGRYVDLGALGVRFLIGGPDTSGRFALVEHPMPPRSLAAPLHRHAREDEYSFVLEGRVGADLGGEIVRGEPGDLIFKPRGQWHTFWNPGDEPARILEIISPAGFEQFFADIADLPNGGDDEPELLVEHARPYGLEFDLDSVPVLLERHGLLLPEL